MESIVNLIPPDCQEVHYCYDFTTWLRHAFICKDNHPVEAVKSAVPFDPLKTFYWLENENNPDLRPEDLRLDAEVLDKGRVRMEIHPGLFRDPKAIDLESVWFGVNGKGWEPGDAIKLCEIGCIWVMAFLRELSTAEIIDDKLIIHKKIHENPAEFEQVQKKAEPKASAKVIRLPKYPRPPKEVMGFCKENYQEGEWRRIIRGLHKWCLYRERREDKYYPGTSERKNRQYVWGQVWLADKLGISRKTVEKWVQRFEADGVIYYPYKGYIGRGASIAELAYTEPHRKMNKRKTGERKNPLSIR